MPPNNHFTIKQHIRVTRCIFEKKGGKMLLRLQGGILLNLRYFVKFPESIMAGIHRKALPCN
jgi:hypothetical protein